MTAAILTALAYAAIVGLLTYLLVLATAGLWLLVERVRQRKQDRWAGRRPYSRTRPRLAERDEVTQWAQFCANLGEMEIEAERQERAR